MKLNRLLKPALKVGAVLLVACVLLALSVIIVSSAMVSATEDSITSHKDIESIEKGKYDYILVFGAGVRADGSLTNMLRDRVIVGARLYHAGVAAKIIMSGDRSGDSYDEPSAMKKFAVELGVPEKDIICDYEGFSTHETVVNFKRSYKASSVVMVSQHYHLHRALYIAKEQGLTTYSGVSSDLETYRKQTIYSAREIIARFKDFMFLN